MISQGIVWHLAELIAAARCDALFRPVITIDATTCRLASFGDIVRFSRAIEGFGRTASFRLCSCWTVATWNASNACGPSVVGNTNLAGTVGGRSAARPRVATRSESHSRR